MASLVRSSFTVLTLGLLAALGCTSKPAVDSAQVEKLRTKHVLAEEPADVKTVSEVRTAMLGEAPPNVLALLEENDDHEHGAEGHADHDEQAADKHSDEHHDDADHQGVLPAAGDHPSEMDVAMVGVVGGVPNPSEQSFAEFPFAKGQTMFFIADPKAAADLEEHGHHHAPGEECSFCAAHAADAKALIAAVSFLDEHGKVVPIDARDAFGLKEHQTVVVKGKARIAAGGILAIEATGLVIRK